jgi:hypothetical protein
MNENIKSLELRDIELGSYGLRSLARIFAVNKTIERLELWSCVSDGFRLLIGAINLNMTLTNLQLVWCKMEPDGWVAL